MELAGRWMKRIKEREGRKIGEDNEGRERREREWRGRYEETGTGKIKGMELDGKWMKKR